MKEYIGTHRNIVFTAIAVITLASYIMPFSSTVQASGHDDLIFDILGGQIVGDDAANIARNLASFHDSSFNTLTQINDQSIEDVSGARGVSGALLVGINRADFDNSNFNTATQSNEQAVRDQLVNTATTGVVVGINDAEFDNSNNNLLDQGNEQSIGWDLAVGEIEIEDVPKGSEASNVGVNNAEFDNSDNNDVGQNNEQEIEDVEDGSEASNEGTNDAEFHNSDNNLVDQSNDQTSGGVLASNKVNSNVGVNNADLGIDEDENGSDNNNVEQSNEQDIKDVSKGSEASNEGVNNAEFHNSDDNDVSQSNDQEIEDVEDDSSASNDAGNSVRLGVLVDDDQPGGD